jgi:membrane-associated phospholipid phosphatase
MAAENQDDDDHDDSAIYKDNDKSTSTLISIAKSSHDDSPLRNNKIVTTIGKSTSAVVAVTFYIVLAIQRDALMVSFFIGAISNGILSKVLKKVLKQARPEELGTSTTTSTTTYMKLKPSDNGMPSSHAMSLGFIGTFAALYLLPWNSLPLLLGYIVLSLIYRVEHKLHTLPQVLVGVSVGSLNGYLWSLLCHGITLTFPLSMPLALPLPFVENIPTTINVMDWVTMHLLNEQELLPLWGLAVPALLGVVIVGSVERRISQFLKQQREPHPPKQE